MEPYERKKAQDRIMAGKPTEKFSEGGNTLDKIAGFVGVGRTTLKKDLEIYETCLTIFDLGITI